MNLNPIRSGLGVKSKLTAPLFSLYSKGFSVIIFRSRQLRLSNLTTELMAKAEYLLSLIKAHFSNENERFITLALQIGAHEAKLRHNLLAQEIKKAVEK